ncbi:MAG TPA: SDR family oxidoreductase [Solirubrobacteraceae bacterium]|nr:SDR family oxidoreductase [Solirubrobacteraceae bacterium]
MDLGLEGKVAFITGGSRGIGRATAEQLVAEGCRVAITARNPDGVDEAVKDLSNGTSNGHVRGIAGDMSRSEDVEAAVQRTLDEFGQIDILVTCAGSSPGGLLENLTEDQWLESLNLKFMGYVRTCRAVLPHMVQRGEGAVVLVVGNDGLKPSYWEMTAGAANAADINFASSLAEQYGPKGIRVNTVNPGPVDTSRWEGLEKAFARDKGVDQDRAHELAVQSIPLGRICTPQEIASVTTFLASPRASFVNGAHVPVDGAQRKGMMDL